MYAQHGKDWDINDEFKAALFEELGKELPAGKPVRLQNLYGKLKITGGAHLQDEPAKKVLERLESMIDLPMESRAFKNILKE